MLLGEGSGLRTGCGGMWVLNSSLVPLTTPNITCSIKYFPFLFVLPLESILFDEISDLADVADLQLDMENEPYVSSQRRRIMG